MCENLSEDLLADFEVAVMVKVLEEALGVQAVLADNTHEGLDTLLDNLTVLGSGLSSSVNCMSANIVQVDVVVLLKSFLGEYFIDAIDKVPPADMLTLLGRLKLSSKQFKFLRRNLNLGHIQPDAELALGYETGPEFVKVTEELSNADALLLAQHT
jgi:hypothetical protein